MKLTEAVFNALDVESTGLDCKVDEVVEIGIKRSTLSADLNIYQSLVRPEQPIPPKASALHHIIDEDVTSSPRLHEIAQTVKAFVQGSVIAAHNAEFDKSFLPFLQYEKWVCTKRLAQHLWPDAPGFSNQVLRYWLKLDAPRDLPTHRAIPDATVTLALLRRELEEYLKQGRPDDLDLFIAYAESPIMYTKILFGNKHRDELISDVIKNDRQYVVWCLDKMQDLDEDMRQSLIKAMKEA